VATYIGVAIYVILYVGYSVYDKFVLRSTTHFIPADQVDLDSSAVWGRGEGSLVREREREQMDSRRKEVEIHAGSHSYALSMWLRRIRERG
jgi:amino acid permease